MFALPNIEFAQPWWFLLLLLIPAMLFWHQKNRKKYHPTVTMPTLAAFGVRPDAHTRMRWRWMLLALRMLAVACLSVAMARPQSPMAPEQISSEGIDIVLAMDVSSSMLAKDFEPDRLEASKKVAAQFIDRRPSDRVGLVVFSGESYTRCPLTTDHQVLKELLASVQCGQIADGTAIGMGLANAVRRLKESKAKSRVVILLTDGVNNAGYTAPLEAAAKAKELGVKVYTIGVGTRGKARSPVGVNMQGEYIFAWTEVEIDEELMAKIAQETGGEYFRATDMESLESIYKRIDEMERSKIETTSFRRFQERFHLWVWLAFGCVVLEIALANTVFKSIV